MGALWGWEKETIPTKKAIYFWMSVLVWPVGHDKKGKLGRTGFLKKFFPVSPAETK
jgi:hypothetical protein